MKNLLLGSLFVSLISAPFLGAQPDAAPAAATGPDPKALYLDPAQPIDARVDDLLKRMTLEEKDTLLHAAGTFPTAAIPRLGIPERWMDDGPNGVREEIQLNNFDPVNPRTDLSDASTAFPSGIGLAATWNPELAQAEGQAIGQEARARNKDIMLGPAVNIERIPLNGRSFEYYGEDPWLSGRIAVGFIHGEQSCDIVVVREALRRQQPGDPARQHQRQRGRAHAARDLPAGLRGRDQGGRLALHHGGLQ